MVPHNEGETDMSKKNRKANIDAPMQVVAAVVQAAELQSIGVQSEAIAPTATDATVPNGWSNTGDVMLPTVEPVATVDVPKVESTVAMVQSNTPKVEVYRELSSKPFDVKIDETTVAPLTNKRALVCALYLVVCEAIGCKVADKHTAVIRFVARLLPYANTGYSKQKGRILLGNEVSTSGMLQYARFLLKPDAAKLMPSGELFARTQQATRIAQSIFLQYGGIEGIDALKATMQHTASK